MHAHCYIIVLVISLFMSYCSFTIVWECYGLVHLIYVAIYIYAIVSLTTAVECLRPLLYHHCIACSRPHLYHHYIARGPYITMLYAVDYLDMRLRVYRYVFILFAQCFSYPFPLIYTHSICLLKHY